jgi:hypothetical protein
MLRLQHINGLIPSNWSNWFWTYLYTLDHNSINQKSICVNNMRFQLKKIIVTSIPTIGVMSSQKLVPFFRGHPVGAFNAM